MVNRYHPDRHDHMPEAEAKHKAVRRHCSIRLIMQATHRYHSSDATRLGDNILDPIGMRAKRSHLFR
jgi:hypothetical protein